jgi:hypothetical protein
MDKAYGTVAAAALAVVQLVAFGAALSNFVALPRPKSETTERTEN